ncbi:MAG: response regulator transcription factor [Nitrospirota bacterium]|jgi:two-component system KDP operon response regulator KdpE|nr:MAG: response regulator transcription factor [Nitrospirota bacterium]
MNKGARILVVDDEREIRRCLELSLEEKGYTVLAAESGEKALDLLKQSPADVAIVDLLLPGIDGIELTKSIRQQSTLPIIILSAIGDDKKKVEALETGADDYVTKPFSIEEVVARIRSVLRRVVGAKDVNPILSYGALVVDFEHREVSLSDELIKLTPMEYELLKYMVQNAGRVLTRRMLLTAVWGPGHEDDTQSLRVLVRQLRKKIEKIPAKPCFILTDPGVGYRFKVEPS